MSNTSSQRDTLPYGAVACVVLTVVLAGAKLSGLLPAIGWGWVVAPVLLPVGVLGIVAMIAATVLATEKLAEGLRQDEERREGLVLWLLDRGASPLYGLDIVERSGGQISRGRVYSLLLRLEEQGLVASDAGTAPIDPRTGLHRISYWITEKGSARVQELETAGRR